MIPLRTPLILFILAYVSACGAPQGGGPISEFRAREITYESRGVRVPATFVRPDTDDKVPIVLMAHGHGGTRDEAGGFRRLAEELARHGIASLRMDFAGCGQSTEAFVENRLASMIADLRAGLAFVRSQPGIDSHRIAVIGYSMGARVAMLSLADGYIAAVLWAPVGTGGPESLFGLFGGEDRYRQLHEEAERSGSASFVTPWGQQQELSRGWFEDMETSRPLQAIAGYRGEVLVVHGSGDPIVPADVAAAVRDAMRASENVHLEIIAGAGHGLGFYSGDPEVGDRVITLSSDFIVSRLFRSR